MNKTLIIIFIIITSLYGCESEPKDIYKTKGGEYASTKGNFIAKFPVIPSVQLIDNNIGTDNFQVNYFHCQIGRHQIYTIEYTDFPDYYLKSWKTEEYYKKYVETLESKFDDFYILSQSYPIKQNGLNGQEFIFSRNEESTKPNGRKGYVEGKVFKIGNRVYSIMYTGEDNERVEPFMSSFRLVKP